MNIIKYLLYWLTHPILCKLGYHRLINWDNYNDLQCWCCEVDK